MPGRRQTSVVEKEERKRIDLKIEVEDFGPITGGEITLKPLTVFIGPNNSGKSYFAMLIHSIFESYTPTASLRGVTLPMGRGFAGRQVWISREQFTEVVRQFDDLEESGELDIPKELLEEVTKRIFEEVYQKRLSDEIIRSFACPLLELIRVEEKSFTLKIGYNSCNIHLMCQKSILEIREQPQLDFKVRVKAIGEHDYVSRYIRYVRPKEKEGKEFLIEIPWRKEKGLTSLLLIDPILNICASRVLENVAMQCYYLPAARSGILQGHKALAASIVRQSPYVGIERLEIPRFSGVVSDFISSVIDLPEDKGPFYQLAQTFENELIKGEVVVRTPDEYLYPEIKYSFRDTEIPLHRSSSTVSELAPLFLYLKYKVKPNSILMIEEPEAHLHPGNQRILAKLLVRLVRSGVTIIITTHSEYLLEQLSNFIMLSKVEPEKRERKYKYNKDDFLKPDEIAAYVFSYDAETAGHRIDEVEITEEDGISQEEFVKIIEALYEETIKLRRDLSDET